MYRYKVRFKRTAKIYESIDDNIKYYIGDVVIIQHNRRNKHIGTVIDKIPKEKKYYDTTAYLCEYISHMATQQDLDHFKLVKIRESFLENSIKEIYSDFFKILDVECQLDDKQIIVYFEPSYSSIKERNCDMDLFKNFLQHKQQLSIDLMYKYRTRVWFQQINYPDTELLSETVIKDKPIKQKESWNLVKANISKMRNKVY